MPSSSFLVVANRIMTPPMTTDSAYRTGVLLLSKVRLVCVCNPTRGFRLAWSTTLADSSSRVGLSSLVGFLFLFRGGAYLITGAVGQTILKMFLGSQSALYSSRELG